MFYLFVWVKVQQGQEPIDVVDFCAVQMDGIMGMEEGILQQRIQSLARQREEMQQMEIELRAQMIAKSEISEMQNSFDARIKEQSNMVSRLQVLVLKKDFELCFCVCFYFSDDLNRGVVWCFAGATS